MNTITVHLSRSPQESKIVFVEGNTFDSLCHIVDMLNSGFAVLKIEERKERTCIFGVKE